MISARERFLEFKNRLQSLLKQIELCVTPSKISLDNVINNYDTSCTLTITVEIHPTLIIAKQFAITDADLPKHEISRHLQASHLIHLIQNQANQTLQKYISEEIKNKIQEIRETREYQIERYVHRKHERSWYRNEKHYQQGINETIRRHLRYYQLEYLGLLEDRHTEEIRPYININWEDREYTNPIDLIHYELMLRNPPLTQKTIHKHLDCCTDCKYHHNDPHLKCAVNPIKPNSISCQDFTPKNQ